MQCGHSDFLGAHDVMLSEYIDIRGKWGVVICYDLTYQDEGDMYAYMESLGMKHSKIMEALDVLLDEINTGLCVSNPRLRMSLIFVGRAESTEQWWDTLTHELYHSQQFICDYYGVRPDSEDGAWTMGYLMRKAVEQIATPCF